MKAEDIKEILAKWFNTGREYGQAPVAKNMLQDLEHEAEISFEAAKQEGRREVVEWIKKYEDTTLLVDDRDNPVASYFFDEYDLKDQLKEWKL